MKSTVLNILGAAGAALIAACVSVPTQLQGEYANITPARVQPDLIGSKVRWGGVIVETRNEKDRTCFEVLSRSLDKAMRPRLEDTTAGRFIACTNGFHDPEVYAKGREVTVTGQVKRLEVHKIEQFDYRYPVLEIDNLVLWEERQDVIIYDRFYDPFYGPYFWGSPYWGWYPYPYYRHPGPYISPRHMRTQKTHTGQSTGIQRNH